MSSKTKSITNFLTALVLLIIFIFAYFLTLDMTPRDKAFPQVILQCLIFFDVILLLISPKPTLALTQLLKYDFKDFFNTTKTVFLKFLFPSVLYFTLIAVIGFMPASVIYLVGTGLLLGEKLKTVLIGTITVMLSVYVIFSYFLDINI